jgi:Ser/Thr protein kinase RdoA (MazF antagonist)
MEEVRRPVDGELCGHVQRADGSWFALVVFGAVPGRHSTREDAVAQVLSG